MRLPPYPRYKPSGVEWLDRVPEHWEVKRLKMVVHLRDKKVEADEENPVPYVGMENIESSTGRLLPIDPDVVPTGMANEFKVGHTLFGKLRPYLAKACNPDFDGLCSTELLVLDSDEIDRRALLYTVLADGFIKLVDSSTFGSKMPRASWDFIGNCIVPVAPSDEQCAIADFLDRETAKIDTLVAKKRTLIERLKEKRTALISRAVTRGLPPDAARAAGLDPHPKLKPSGIDWLGDVPEHWTPKRLRFISPHITVGIVVEPSKYYEEEGIPCLRSLNVRPNVLVDRDLVYISAESHRVLAKSMLHKGDLVAVRSGQPGTTAVVDDRFDGANCIDLIIIREPRAGSATFVSYFLNSLPAQAQFSGGAGGAIQQHFNITTAADLWLIEPPIREQGLIADFLDRETAKSDTMITKVETAIERLQEYRTALITAAVTGKIDVRRETNGG